MSTVTLSERRIDVPGVKTLHQGDPEYDVARRVWNDMIDEQPAAIACCRDADDVVSSIGTARRAGLPISVRGGGHNIAGNAVRTGALMIDLSAMRAVTVDSERPSARVEGGATLADLDRATQVYGLATPSGVVSDTGVGGLTLGGGFGWLSRLHGLSIDNLLAVEIILADGSRVRATTEENSELFWALCGGGGNFGVVTAFEFRLHRVGPEVLFGPTVFRLSDAHAVMREWVEFIDQAPRSCTVWADLATAPPAPFLPECVHGEKILILMQSWVGDPEAGETILHPIKDHPAAVGGFVARRPYVEAQSFLDQTYAKGARNYWGTTNYGGVGDELIADLVDITKTLPTVESDILICAQGGAIDDVPVDASAYPHRGVPFLSSHGARWREPADDTRMLAWARETGLRLDRHRCEGVYVNFVAEREGRVDEAYTSNYARLAEIKRRYDPDNLFRVNQNITPAALSSD